jgi:predicted transcriptional regulator
LPPWSCFVPRESEQLSRREREIMDAVFAHGGDASVEDVRARLKDPPGYSAVRAMLARLEAKGHLRHREDGLRYLYSATIPRNTARRKAFRHYLQVFFDGSRGQLLSSLLEDEAWSEGELEELARTIERVRAGRRAGNPGRREKPG